jgi:hypothetical protein
MAKFDQAISFLDLVINDRTVPKNIRRAAENAKNALESNNPEELKVSTAISILDEIINDPNMPIYARTKIWNAVSILEQMRRK